MASHSTPRRSYLVGLSVRMEKGPIPAADGDPIYAGAWNHLTTTCGYSPRRARSLLVPRVSETHWDSWIISPRADGQPLDRHLTALRDRLRLETLCEALRQLDRPLEVCLSIGICYDTYTCTLHLTAEQMAFLASLNVEVEWCTYPTNFSSTQGLEEPSEAEPLGTERQSGAANGAAGSDNDR